MTETFQEAVQRLKNKENAKALGLHTPEDQQIFRQVGRTNCMWFDGHQWLKHYVDVDGFNPQISLVIAEDYQPEPKKPKTVDLPIEKKCDDKFKRLGCEVGDIFWYLHELPSLPGFRGFWEGGGVAFSVRLTSVASRVDGGSQVVARMEVQE